MLIDDGCDIRLINTQSESRRAFRMASRDESRKIRPRTQLVAQRRRRRRCLSDFALCRRTFDSYEWSVPQFDSQHIGLLCARRTRVLFYSYCCPLMAGDVMRCTSLRG